MYGAHPPLLPALEVAEVVRLAGDGALIVDVRDVAAFAGGHIPGSLSIPLRDAFATWLGWLVDADRPLAFVLDGDQDAAEVVRQALNIGYERLAGALAGGIDAWTSAGRDVERIDLVAVAEATGPVLDIRQRAEYTAGHLPGAVNIELGSLAQTPPQRGPLTLMCGHGERAMTAASILAAADHANLTVAVGGPADWAAADGRRLETGA